MGVFIMKVIILFFIYVNLFADDIVDLFKNKNNFKSQIESLFNPFEHNIIKNKIVKKRVYNNLKLEAIFNNSVKISGKWYKLHDKISQFTISLIKKDKVYLKSHNKVEILTFKRNKKLYISLN
jgi:hypothetical protein